MPKKHQIAYTKPEEPSFLKRLKLEAGYKEGPTVETKRQDLGGIAPEDLEDLDEEQPQVVQLRAGDLTQEEADREKARLEREEESKPVDLSSAVFTFKKPSKKSPEPSKRPLEKTKEEKKKSKKLKNSERLLSFDQQDEEEED